MTPLQAIFIVVGLVTFIAAIMVIASPRLIHAGLWLILTLAGVAILFVLLQATFLAVVQVLVYIGAIAILIIFAVMLTRRVMDDPGPQHNSNWWAATIVSIILFAGLIAVITQVPAFSATPDVLTAEQQTIVEQLGRELVDVDAFIIPFEVASVLLLAAMIGAIIIALPTIQLMDEDQEE